MTLRAKNHDKLFRLDPVSVARDSCTDSYSLQTTSSAYDSHAFKGKDSVRRHQLTQINDSAVGIAIRCWLYSPRFEPRYLQ